jgi:hypothetical protein
MLVYHRLSRMAQALLAERLLLSREIERIQKAMFVHSRHWKDSDRRLLQRRGQSQIQLQNLNAAHRYQSIAGRCVDSFASILLAMPHVQFPETGR